MRDSESPALLPLTLERSLSPLPSIVHSVYPSTSAYNLLLSMCLTISISLVLALALALALVISPSLSFLLLFLRVLLSLL